MKEWRTDARHVQKSWGPMGHLLSDGDAAMRKLSQNLSMFICTSELGRWVYCIQLKKERDLANFGRRSPLRLHSSWRCKLWLIASAFSLSIHTLTRGRLCQVPEPDWGCPCQFHVSRHLGPWHGCAHVNDIHSGPIALYIRSELLHFHK